jgi:subtilisin
MRPRLLAIFSIAALVSVLLSAQSTLAAAAETMGNYVVVLEDDAGDPATLAAQQTAALGGTVGFIYTTALRGYSASLPVANVPTLEADPTVAYVMADRTLSIQAQTLPTGIDRVDGELSSTVSGNGRGSVNVDVAVLDTGISTSHPDLNVVGGRDCVTPATPTFDDPNGHGTHVAGTIAARDDDQGVVGVAPGARLWSVRVLDAFGSGALSQVVCGVDFVTANAATIEVANMSLTGRGADPGSGCKTGDALHDAICNSVRADVTYVVAAGNNFEDAANFIPAAYDEVITVSGLADSDGKPGGLGPTCEGDVDDTFYNSSNFGADIDLIAPAVCILSDSLGGGVATDSGTSMASAHVAGAAALGKSRAPSAMPSQVRHGLQAAGNLNWNNSEDPDGIKETLVNVDAL